MPMPGPLEILLLLPFIVVPILVVGFAVVLVRRSRQASDLPASQSPDDERLDKIEQRLQKIEEAQREREQQ